MLEKRKNQARFLIMLLLCIGLLAGLGMLLLHNMQLRKEYEALEAHISQNRQQMEKLQEERDSLEQQAEELKEELERTEQQLQAPPLQRQQVERQVEGALRPSQGNSVFSDGQGYAPGAILSYEEVQGNLEAYFQAYPIAEGDGVFQRINGRSYRENPDVGLEDLRYLKLLHYNFDHQIQVGEIIVNTQVAEDVLSIFKELFAIEYEIQSVYLIDNYWTEGMTGEDADFASIEENNTSSFNYRPVTGGSSLSYHAFGRAIDINPQQNPYVTAAGEYSHANAAPYVDRTSGDPHVIVNGDPCYNIFAQYGFAWGGDWEDPIDYQHFERRE